MKVIAPLSMLVQKHHQNSGKAIAEAKHLKPSIRRLEVKLCDGVKGDVEKKRAA